MVADGEAQRLLALPLQVIERPGSAIVRRGRSQLRISGEGGAEALSVVIGALQGAGETVEQVCDRFAMPHREAVRQLIHELRNRNFVVPADSELIPTAEREDCLGVFYWHFGASSAQVTRQLNTVRFGLVGVNLITRQIARSLREAGVNSLAIIDDPLLRNSSLSSAEGDPPPGDLVGLTAKLNEGHFDCVVAASDFGGIESIKRWNSLCFQARIPFMPVVLQDLVGYIGPHVIPGETACYACFIARTNSNQGSMAPEEESAFEHQHLSGSHPAMTTALGAIAAIELTKFYSRAMPFWKVGAVLEVNLIGGWAESRRVLRVPRCNTCSGLVSRSTTSMVKGTLASKVVDS